MDSFYLLLFIVKLYSRIKLFIFLSLLFLKVNAPFVVFSQLSKHYQTWFVSADRVKLASVNFPLKKKNRIKKQTIYLECHGKRIMGKNTILNFSTFTKSCLLFSLCYTYIFFLNYLKDLNSQFLFRYNFRHSMAKIFWPPNI